MELMKIYRKGKQNYRRNKIIIIIILYCYYITSLIVISY